MESKMEHRKHLMKMIDKFSIQSVEEFKEAENKIIADSKFRTLTKKKDYLGHIETLRKVKSRAQRINPQAVPIPDDDRQALELRRAFEKCLIVFSAVCDSYIQMQQVLDEKANGAKIPYGEYKEFFNKVKQARASFNTHMNDMDILYSDLVEYAEDINSKDDFGGIEYMTYDSIK
ncbi:MAG: hypothetical protein MJ161_00080 [Clostridia bacterium]|nr:hypothetical protein [Clostridia bacterium]